MSQISRTYKLRRFDSSRDPDYGRALGLYVTNIGPDARTNSNEITYWLDRSYREFGDEFIVCGFYVDRQIAGFSEFAYFKKQRVLIFDYLLLHREFRTHGEYFQFVRMLQDWVNNERLEFDYAVAEVGFESATSTPSERSILLVELFKQMGFLVADCEYWHAPLGTDNPQSDMRAHLLIAARESPSSICREALLNLVRTIYFQHNERWYMETLADEVERKHYHDVLQHRFEQFIDNLNDRAEIGLNGVKLLNPPLVPTEPPGASRRPMLLLPIVVTTSIGLFAAAILTLQHALNTPEQLVISVLGITLLVFVTSFALFNKGAMEALRHLLSVMGSLFDKTK